MGSVSGKGLPLYDPPRVLTAVTGLVPDLHPAGYRDSTPLPAQTPTPDLPKQTKGPVGGGGAKRPGKNPNQSTDRATRTDIPSISQAATEDRNDAGKSPPPPPNVQQSTNDKQKSALPSTYAKPNDVPPPTSEQRPQNPPSSKENQRQGPSEGPNLPEVTPKTPASVFSPPQSKASLPSDSFSLTPTATRSGTSEEIPRPPGTRSTITKHITSDIRSPDVPQTESGPGSLPSRISYTINTIISMVTDSSAASFPSSSVSSSLFSGHTGSSQPGSLASDSSLPGISTPLPPSSSTESSPPSESTLSAASSSSVPSPPPAASSSSTPPPPPAASSSSTIPPPSAASSSTPPPPPPPPQQPPPIVTSTEIVAEAVEQPCDD
ncbi:hypothetical protein ACLMJK_005678 [Lecanora helva]